MVNAVPVGEEYVGELEEIIEGLEALRGTALEGERR